MIEQKEWFDTNIKPDDYHLLIWSNETLIAYLNAVKVEIRTETSLYRALGIGNVCVSKTEAHRGIGSIMMACINSYIASLNIFGVLLCKKELVPFYTNSNWQILETENVFIKEERFENIVMIYDAKRRIDFRDKSNEIHLSRSF